MIKRMTIVVGACAALAGCGSDSGVADDPKSMGGAAGVGTGSGGSAQAGPSIPLGITRRRVARMRARKRTTVARSRSPTSIPNVTTDPPEGTYSGSFICPTREHSLRLTSVRPCSRGTDPRHPAR